MPQSPGISVALRVATPAGMHRFMVPMGVSVRDALDPTELRVRAACGGTGGCGACTVIWLGGEVSPPTVAEYTKIQPADRAAGVRLACQMRLRGDVDIRIDDPALPSAWKSIPPENLMAAPAGLPGLQSHVYGVAVDLGTTHIRVSLWNRRLGKRIATRRGPNPQWAYGADVLNRIAAAPQGTDRSAELAKLARTAIVSAIRDILKRDVGEVSPMLAEIGQVMIVGNTAMLALLTGRGADDLLDPAHWNRAVDCRPEDSAAFHAQWFMPNARVLVAGPVAGFIGSDLLADLIAVRIDQAPAGTLLLDIGTNTEIALWDGGCLHVTAVPGGPAFEGVGLANGMAAEPGAICRIARDGDGYRLETIAGSPARGFCGSGLVDGIAALLAGGMVKPSGRFAADVSADGFRFDPGNPRTAILGRDIDLFQRAKAATAAAMEALLLQAGMGWGDVAALHVCGAFGHTLDIANAQAVGLLPPLPAGRIALFADAGLAGCETALLHPDGISLFDRLAGCCNAINLSLLPGYDDEYIDHLRLRPIDTGGK